MLTIRTANRMAISKEPKDKITEDEQLVIKTDSGYGWRRKFRVVSFVVNGVPRAPIIEARVYRDRDEHKYGRSVGMSFEEAKSLVENWEQVRSLWFGK